MIALPFIIAALIRVESGGNDRAVGSLDEVGCLQIRPILVEDVNRIQGVVRFTLEDAYSRERSVAMFRIYVGHYATRERLGHEPTEADVAMIWHRGPNGWREADADGYLPKVIAALRDLGASAAAPATGGRHD